MLDNQVIYDCFNASLDSKPFKVSKVRVCSEYLESRSCSRYNLTVGRTIFELDKTFWIDPNAVPKHEALVSKAVSKRRQRSVVTTLENLTGVFCHGSGLAQIDSFANSMCNLSPLIREFESKVHDSQVRFQVFRLYLLDNLSKRDICVRLSITTKRLESILATLSSRTGNPINRISNPNLSAQETLLANSGLIMSRFKRTSFRMVGLASQLVDLKKAQPALRCVSLKQYKRFITKRLGFRYRQYKRTYKDPDKKHLLDVRKSVAFLLGKLVFRDCLILFFDSTSFSDTSFKKYAWTLDRKGTPRLLAPKVYGYVNLFVACSTDRIINYWIVKSVNRLTTASFLYETIRYCRSVLGHQRILVLLDNARIHKTTLVKKLAEKLSFYLLLNPPYSSKMNLVEYVFERVKRPLRQMNSKGKWIGIAKLLRNRMIEIRDMSLAHETRRFYRSLLTALYQRKFWSQ